MSKDFIVVNGLLVKKFSDKRRKIPSSDKAEDIVFALMDNIVNRRGFRQVWDDCDETIREEILSELYEKTKRIIGK